MRCHAYNQQGGRCEQAATHKGNHRITITWSDEESWVPGATVELTLREYGTAGLGAAVTPQPVFSDEPTVCVLCDHPFHRGKCRAADGEFTCDCAEGIA